MAYIKTEMKMPSEPLFGSNIGLRPFRRDDAASLHRILSDPDVFRFAFSGLKKTFSETEAALHKILQRTAKADARKIDWALVRIQDGLLLGKASLHHPKEDSVMMGIFLDKSYWGLGYGSEAVLLLMRAAAELGFRKLVGSCHPENLASERIMQKSGMRCIGLIPDFEIKKGLRVLRKVYEIVL